MLYIISCVEAEFLLTPNNSIAYSGMLFCSSLPGEDPLIRGHFGERRCVVVHKVLGFLNRRVEEVIVVSCLGVMTLVIGLQVFMRYVMQNSLSWSEELARYLFIFFIYAGISYGVKMQRHIRVEAFTMWLPKKARAVILMLSNLLFLAFATFVIYFGWQTALRIFKVNQISPALELKMGYVYATLPFCYVLVAIRLVQELYHSAVSLIRGEGKGE